MDAQPEGFEGRPLERAHPGSGRKRARVTPKGRQVDPAARIEIVELIGDRPLNRDLLIEHLHLIQDRFRRISSPHLAALADIMRLSFAEVFEVATFYAHFDVTDEPAPDTVIRVCDSLACAMAGAEAMAEAIAAGGYPRVVRVPCVGRCDAAPVAEVGHHFLDHTNAAEVIATARAGDIAPVIPRYLDFDEYIAAGGYTTLKKVRDGAISADEVIGTLDKSGLRGLGGAGFPTARKWKTLREQQGPRLMAVNADEGEPGTFKDRYHLERDPHRFIEGMLIAAHVVGCDEIYVYVRDEYPAAFRILGRELARLPPNNPPIHVRRGAGAYICGEESSMIESIEGKRGLPRHKPPLIFQTGLFGRPTLANNLETLWWVRDIVEHGADWWTAKGVRGGKGLRSYSVSGRVQNPGVQVMAAGSTVAELIEACGGMLDGHTFTAYLPGGASGGILPARMNDIPLDFGTLEQYGCFIGSAAVVILSNHDDLKQTALGLMKFFEHESCGQCTPCRVGTEKAAVLMADAKWDVPLLEELSAVMRDASICGLGQAAPNPLTSIIRHFPEELAR